MKNYRDLDIYNESYRLAVEVHKMTFKLPKYELYEEGSQIRRSSKSITSNIVEGYGRRKYKAEFIRFLIFSHLLSKIKKGFNQSLKIIMQKAPAFIYLELNANQNDLIENSKFKFSCALCYFPIHY